MKRIVWILCLCIVCLNSFAQSKKVTKKAETPNVEAQSHPATSSSTQQHNTSISTGGYLCNPPLPYKPDRLNILFIGNSFSIDTATALPSLFNSLGINHVNVFVLYRAACSMKQHYEFFHSKQKAYELYLYNIHGEQLLEKSTTINEVLSRAPYDIVVFQQYSLESGDYTTYEPYLAKLIQAYNLVKTSPRTTFAFNQTWAYSSKNKDISKYQTQHAMWQNICSSVQQMKAHSGIDIIIPCGTAVQNARSVEALNIDDELTRDTKHINLYAGRYLLACTFFESIIAPCTGANIKEDTNTFGKVHDIGIVNEANRTLLQNCARLAVANNYTISEFAGQ